MFARQRMESAMAEICLLKPYYLAGLTDTEWDEWLKLTSQPLIQPLPRAAILKASEDGRKRSTLPPLEREATFQRKPRYFNPHEGTVEEAADSHWKKKYEKVSIEVDNRIKTHLKKQMMTRVEKRLKRMEEVLSDGTSDRHGHDYNPWEGKSDRHRTNGEKGDIFNKYTETGVRTTPPARQNGTSEHVLPEINASRKVLHEPFTHASPKVQFPDISKNGDNDETDKGGLSETTRTVSISDEPVHINGNTDLDDLDDQQKVFELTRLETKFSESVENFRHLEVSPVSTPLVVRPLTREQTRLGFDEQMNRILHGHAHITCPNNNNVMRVYISSGFSDSEAERTVLMERTYPELRTLCRLHGKDLQLVDPHGGLKDSVTDDHSVPEVCIANLEQCNKDHLQAVNMLIIMTDRYGDLILPSTIPVDDFESMLELVKATTNAERYVLERQIAELENPGMERAPANQNKDDATESDTCEVNVNGNSVGYSDKSTISSNQSQDDKNTEKSVDTSIKTKTYRKEADVKKEQQVLKNLQEKLLMLPNPDLLQTWYLLDENAQPHVYRLQTISSVIRDFTRGDASRREMAKNNWLGVQDHLLNIIQRFGRDPRDGKTRLKSMLEMELEHGLLDVENNLDQCFVINRVIDDITDNINDDRADEYIDVLGIRPYEIDTELQSRLANLKNHVVPSKVPEHFILPMEVSWAPAGIRVGGDRMHQTYLDRFAKHVTDVFKKRLLESFKEDDHTQSENSKLFDDVSQHLIFAQDRSKNFQGMKESLQIIKSYVRSGCRSVLAIHGRAGCGKSSILAKAAKETHRWLKGHDAAVLVRSIGSTTESTNIRNLLHGICLQLCVIFGNDQREVPTDFIGLINDFSRRLEQASEKRPLIIFIDALDRLVDDHEGRKLSWLPKKLPQHVHVIVSTLPGEQFEVMPSLKALLANDNDLFLEIPELEENDASVILRHWFNVHNHSLTEEQYETLVAKFKKCPSPLFLKLLFNESLSWASYDNIEANKLPDTIKMVAAMRFSQMEMKYGECFVRRAIGYLAASRNGLTDIEMLDLLSLDDSVISETRPNSNLSRRRVPSSLWFRLRHDLAKYITERNADGVKTLQWTHWHFFEAANERYLKQRDKAPSYHKTMAEYFLGTWATKPKPYPGNDKGSLRYVMAQPLYWEPREAKEDGSDRIYNLRKINELPHHLLRSQQMQLYKSEAMCNFEWTLAKLCGTSLRSLVEEYHIGLEAEPTDMDLKTLSDTLQLSANAVLRDPRQLAGQVVGRLQGIINRDVPLSPGDPPKYPYLHAFLAQAKTTSIPALIPSIGCLTEPGGILYDLLSGHSKAITAVTTTTDAQRALTASEDNTMKVWDLKTGKVTTTINDFGTNVSKLRTASNNKYAIAVEGSIIKIWCLRSNTCLFVVDQFLDPPVIAVASEGKLLVALFDGVNILRTWDLEDEFKFVCEAKIPDNSVFSDNSVVLAQTSYGDHVLHAFRGNNFATIQHARTGRVIHTLKCNDTTSSVVALAITRDYMIVACRQHYMKLHEIHQLEMFDAKKGKYLRSIRGCTQDIITEIHINLVGSHAISICASEASNASNIMIWNLETEDHKHLAKHSGVSTVSACADFRYCLTAQKGDNTLKIWNISKNINQPMPKLKKSLGVAEIHPMIDNPRYAIARQVNHGPVSIWNVAKAKCLASAVRIERGLSEFSDVVLIRNCNVVILTEKGLKESRPVFKTVLIYDLRTKKYVKKLKQCYIVPSPANDYVLLDDETLLGPADTRNHFIIWSLVTGKEMFRIRPKFNDIDRKGPALEADLEHSLQVRASTAKLLPWDRRTESASARQKRRARDREEERQNLEEIQKEKQNGIEQYIISGDLKVIVASFYAHHLAVFNISTKLHVCTLENEHSMLFLHVSALSYDGSNLVHANYDESSKISYVTLWDTTTGQVKKRLKHETDVLAIAITDDGSRVVFGKENKELRVWDPNTPGAAAMKKVKGHDSLEFGVDSKIFILNKGERAVVFAGDISLWDLENATLLAVFTPDTRIECLNVVMSGQLITMGVHEFPELVVLKIMGKDVKTLADTEHEDLFGESTGDTSDEEEDDDDI